MLAIVLNAYLQNSSTWGGGKHIQCICAAAGACLGVGGWGLSHRRSAKQKPRGWISTGRAVGGEGTQLGSLFHLLEPLPGMTDVGTTFPWLQLVRSSGSWELVPTRAMFWKQPRIGSVMGLNSSPGLAFGYLSRCISLELSSYLITWSQQYTPPGCCADEMK